MRGALLEVEVFGERVTPAGIGGECCHSVFLITIVDEDSLGFT
jgi:hypothetical protein